MSNHLPHRIKEMVLAELRSVKAIQTDYSNVVDLIQKHLELYKKSKGTPEEKKHVAHLKTLNDKKKKLAAELNDKVSDMYKDAELKVDEMNTTGGVEGYNTPFAFSGKDSEEKKGKRQADLTGYSVVKESELKGYLAADVVDDIIKSIGSKFVSGEIKNAPNRNYIYLKLTDIKFGSGVVKMLKSQFGIDAKVDKTFGNIPTVSFASKKVVSEGKYYVTYNKGRGQGKGLEKEFDQKNFRTTDKPKVFNSFKDAKKYAEAAEKMFRNSIGGGVAYYVSDEKMNKVEESVNEGSKVHFEKELKNGKIFQVIDRDTTGMRGTQDKFRMQIVDKSGKVVKDLGSHPSIKGAEKFGDKFESINEAIRNTPAKTGKELADSVLRWYDFYTNYIDDGGQRRRAIKSNEDISEWFDSHPNDLKKDALKIIKSKVDSSNHSQVQRVFGKSTTDK